MKYLAGAGDFKSTYLFSIKPEEKNCFGEGNTVCDAKIYCTYQHNTSEVRAIPFFSGDTLHIHGTDRLFISSYFKTSGDVCFRTLVI
jgi:hypothetical protein